MVAVQELEKVSDTRRSLIVDEPIGVGKTSLATRLAESFWAELVLERATAIRYVCAGTNRRFSYRQGPLVSRIEHGFVS